MRMYVTPFVRVRVFGCALSPQRARKRGVGRSTDR